MTQSDNDFLANLLGEQKTDDPARLAEAKGRAPAEGKEPFSLERLESLFDTSSFMGDVAPEAERLARYEKRYYVDFPDVKTIAELAQRLQQLEELGN